MYNITDESAAAYAQNILTRVRGAEKVMETAGVHECHVWFSPNGRMTIGLTHVMRNGDALMYTYTAEDGKINYSRRAIVDDNGEEVA